jgi:hypothetical protein
MHRRRYVEVLKVGISTMVGAGPHGTGGGQGSGFHGNVVGFGGGASVGSGPPGVVSGQ